MVDVKTVVVFVVAVLSAFIQPGIRAQPTIASSSEDDSCSQLEEELDFKVVEHNHLRSALENKQQKIETLEIASNSQAEEIHRLHLELESKQQKIETQENVSSTQVEENRRLNMELENKQRLIASLRNVSSAQTKEINRLNIELENKQQLIAILRNSSSVQTIENHRLKMELESINQINQIKQQLIVTLRNESRPQMKENQQLNMDLEHKQQLIALLRNYSSAQTKENYQLNIELENKQQLIATLRNVSTTQTTENQRLNLELKTKQQMIDTLKNVSNSQSVEIQRLKLENERHRQRTQPATATIVGTLDTSGFEIGMTKVEDRIYVLEYFKSRVHVYQDDFRFIREIALNSRTEPYDIVYSNKSKCVYISDDIGKCIWAMATTGMHRLTKWLNNVASPHTLSLSNEGHLLVLRHQPSSLLEIYSVNATLIRRLQLPQDVMKPSHVVQTLDGNFIISHQLNNASIEQSLWAISKLTNDGQLMYRFYSSNQSDKLNVSAHLSLDSKNNRLFVADYNNHRVILFDSSTLTWIRVLLSREMNGILNPFRLFYDESKKHLFVAQYDYNVTVYEIN